MTLAPEICKPMRDYSASIWCKEAVILLTNFAREAGKTAEFINQFESFDKVGATQTYVDFPVQHRDLDLSLDEVSARSIAPAMSALCAVFPKKIEVWPLLLPESYANAAREALYNFSLRCVWTDDEFLMTDYADHMPARVVRYDIMWRPLA